jgi:hypothetical protein
VSGSGCHGSRWLAGKLINWVSVSWTPTPCTGVVEAEPGAALATDSAAAATAVAVAAPARVFDSFMVLSLMRTHGYPRQPQTRVIAAAAMVRPDTASLILMGIFLAFSIAFAIT